MFGWYDIVEAMTTVEAGVAIAAAAASLIPAWRAARVDPATALFFQAVCEHQLLMKKEGLKTIDSLLDQGRESLANRDQVYEDIIRRFAEQVHNLWGWYTPLTVAMATDVNGVPGESPDSAEGFPGLASGHRVEYMWVEQ